jgi:sporulation protein YlmC with PRC-barrel domain
MADREIPVVPKDDDASIAPGLLMPLRHLHGFRIAEGEPDIRGWKVVLADGRRVGKVDDLIVDTTDLVVKYLEVKVDHEVLGTDEDTWRLVPIGAARLDDEGDVVVIDRLPEAGLTSSPGRARGAPSQDEERAVRDYYESSTRAAGGESGLFDQGRFWGTRRGSRGQSGYLARTDEAATPVVEALVVEEVIVEGEPAEPAEPPAGAPRGARRASEDRSAEQR